MGRSLRRSASSIDGAWKIVSHRILVGNGATAATLRCDSRGCVLWERSIRERPQKGRCCRCRIYDAFSKSPDTARKFRRLASLTVACRLRPQSDDWTARSWHAPSLPTRPPHERESRPLRRINRRRTCRHGSVQQSSRRSAVRPWLKCRPESSRRFLSAAHRGLEDAADTVRDYATSPPNKERDRRALCIDG